MEKTWKAYICIKHCTQNSFAIVFLICILSTLFCSIYIEGKNSVATTCYYEPYRNVEGKTSVGCYLTYVKCTHKIENIENCFIDRFTFDLDYLKVLRYLSRFLCCMTVSFHFHFVIAFNLGWMKWGHRLD
jgi:hypothetical protein